MNNNGYYFSSHHHKVNPNQHTIDGKPYILDPIFQGLTEYYFAIPDYPDFSISNFHQVRSNATGKVLTKYITHHGNKQTHVYILKPMGKEYQKADVYTLFKRTWFSPKGYNYYKHEEILNSRLSEIGLDLLPEPVKDSRQ